MNLSEGVQHLQNILIQTYQLDLLVCCLKTYGMNWIPIITLLKVLV